MGPGRCLYTSLHEAAAQGSQDVLQTTWRENAAKYFETFALCWHFACKPLVRWSLGSRRTPESEL